MGVLDRRQYNFLDSVNEEAIAYAAGKGVGVSVMGPVAGGRILDLKQKGIKGIKDIDLADLALRFVFSDKNISTALSGMENMKMLESNIKTAEGPEDISGEERDFIILS